MWLTIRCGSCVRLLFVAAFLLEVELMLGCAKPVCSFDDESRQVTTAVDIAVIQLARLGWSGNLSAKKGLELPSHP